MLLEIDFNEVILKMLLVYFGPNKKSFSNIAEMCQKCTYYRGHGRGCKDEFELRWNVSLYISQKIIMYIGLNYIDAFILS